MHIPPYYKNKAWQRFLAGILVGTLIGYYIFIFLFGQLQEDWIEENLALRGELQELQQNYETLLENHRALDQQTKEDYQIEEIKINFLNTKELKIDNDRIMLYQLEEAINEEANQAVGKNIDDIADSIDLLISAIENKTINIDDFRYQAQVEQIIVSRTLTLSIRLKIGN